MRQLRLFLLYTTIWLPSIQALLVRSEGSGGLATGMTYEPESETLVIIGTTFDKSFWGAQQQNLEDKGECFVAVGYVSRLEQPEFLRATLPQPAYCFGSIHNNNDLTPNDSGAIEEAVTYFGVLLEEAGPKGFLETMYYTTSLIQPSGFEVPYELPSSLLPVAVASSILEPSSVYIGLHDPRELFGTGGGTPSEILEGLLSDWWSATSPWQMKQTLDSSFTPAPMVPQLSKVDISTGEIEFTVLLDAQEMSATALISGILISPIKTSGREEPPIIVVGSTNSPDSESSLFGFSGSEESTFDSADFDGYVLFLEPGSGTISNDTTSGTWAWRISSTGDNTNDFVEGACLSPDHRYLYVVGTTEGILTGTQSGGAFAIKYDLSTGDMVWQYQVAGEKVQGLLCTADDEAVYLGGVTESDLWESPGKNSPTQSPDAYVAKIIDGIAKWIRPLDTSLEEQGELRREWITGMEVTKQGTILVLLNSMNLDSGASDVFLVDLHPEMGENDLYGAINYFNDGISTFNSLSKEEREEKEVAIAAIVVPVLVALGVFGLTCWWQYRSKKERISELERRDNAQKQAKDEIVATPSGSELL